MESTLFTRYIKISFVTLLSTVAAFLLAVLFNNELRSSLRTFITPEFRLPVSRATGTFQEDGGLIEVVKIKTRDALTLEIYRSQSNGSKSLLQKIELDQKKDGYFTINGQATSLALDDIDDDHTPEILAAGFDKNLTARLNVFKYNRMTKLFERLSK